MKITIKCPCCGKMFTKNSGNQKYCSEECAETMKQNRKKLRHNVLNGLEPIIEMQSQEYLCFSQAATLMGCSRQYIYKLVGQGKLNASRLSSRMALIRKADIEKMFEANPYQRVLPTIKPKHKSVNTTPTLPKKESRENKDSDSSEVLDYYSGEEVMSIYKVKQSWLYTSAKRQGIPMCRIAGKNYYSKRHIDECFGMAVDISTITDWMLPEDIETQYGMSRTAIRAYAYRHRIPAKREYGRTYYSKSHLDELRRVDLVNDADYYTVEQVQDKYGIKKANIHHIVKVNKITKVKVGVRNLLLKSDVERVMSKRFAQE